VVRRYTSADGGQIRIVNWNQYSFDIIQFSIGGVTSWPWHKLYRNNCESSDIRKCATFINNYIPKRPQVLIIQVYGTLYTDAVLRYKH